MKRDRIKEDIELKEETPIVEKPKKKRDGVIVHVNIPNLAIRVGAGTDFDKTRKIIGNVKVELDKVAPGEGSKKGWGKLKNSEGWINLDFTDYEA